MEWVFKEKAPLDTTGIRSLSISFGRRNENLAKFVYQELSAATSA
jgi:hypothetical protein